MDRARAGRARGVPGRRGRRLLAAAAGERGVALILVICTVGILLLLGLSLLIVISADMRGAVRERDRLRAFYIAEGGLERAMFVLTGDPAWRAGETAPLGAGQFIVTLSDEPPDLVRITSRGEAGSQARTLTALVRAGGGGPFDHALFSHDAFNFKNDATVLGDVQVNGNVQCNGDVTIEGELALSGNLDNKGTLVATEGIVEGAPEVTPPELDLQWYRDNATIRLPGGTTINGGVYDDGIVFVDGRVVLRGVFSGSVTIVSTGEATITNNVTRVNSDDIIHIISDNKVTVDGAATVEATLWSPLKVEIRGGTVTVSGSLLGGNVQVEAQNLILLCEDFGCPPGTPPSGGLELVEWQEGS